MAWHAGQMFGFLGDTASAQARFRGAFDPTEPADSPVRWNTYVRATLAFLARDLVALQGYRDAMVGDPNFAVVDGLLRCFEETYLAAYACRTP